MMTEAALQRGALAELPDRLAALQHSVSTTEAGLYAATLLLFEAELACLQQQPRRAAAKFREAAQVAAIQGATTLQAQALQQLTSLQH